MNPVRVEYLVNRVGSLRGVSVLDVGCGGGILSESLARMGAIVTGIDPSVHNIDVARQHAGVDPLTRGIHYEKATAEEMLGKSAWPGLLPTRLCVGQLMSCA
jgi:2-polyprenyl-6-hydroxyphenyl methylase/3-demethylubiquinone-9 3-methyltransferase